MHVGGNSRGGARAPTIEPPVPQSGHGIGGADAVTRVTVDAKERLGRSRLRIAGDVLEVLKIFVNGGVSTAILPKTIGITAEQVFRAHDLDSRQVRIPVQLGADHLKRGDVSGRERIRATAVELLEIQFV